MQNNKVIIIPTYDEKNNIEKLVNDIIRIDKNIDILFVDGNSQDGTKKILNKLSSQYSNINVIYEEKKQGLAKAYIKGFKRALKKNYDIFLQMDADFQHNPKYIPKLLKHAKCYDIVIGCRDLNIKRIFEPIPIRIKLSILANIYINLITGMNLSDTLAGYKCYSRKALRTINWDHIYSKEFIFQTEILYKISGKGYSIKEIPIIFGNRKSGYSKISIWTFIEGFFRILQLRLMKVLKKI